MDCDKRIGGGFEDDGCDVGLVLRDVKSAPPSIWAVADEVENGSSTTIPRGDDVARVRPRRWAVDDDVDDEEARDVASGAVCLGGKGACDCRRRRRNVDGVAVSAAKVWEGPSSSADKEDCRVVFVILLDDGVGDDDDDDDASGFLRADKEAREVCPLLFE